MRALALALALLAHLVLAPARASGVTDRADEARWPAPPARGDEGWPAAEREDFLALCRSAGPEPFCGCWLDTLEPRYRSLGAFLKDASRSSGASRAALEHEVDRCWQRHGHGR